MLTTKQVKDRETMLQMLEGDPVPAAARAVEQIETCVGNALTLLERLEVNELEVYRAPADRLAALYAARDEINRAIIAHLAARWPAQADYDAHGKVPFGWDAV
jgi:hypothetical protein